LAVLATMPGNLDDEREIHARFDQLRFGRTEQFRPAPDLMAFVGRPLLVDANPDAVEAMPTTRKPPGSIWLPADVMSSARIVPAYTGEPISDMLGGMLRPLLAKREKEEAAKRAKQMGGGAK
jgi:hypothetical protein